MRFEPGTCVETTLGTGVVVDFRPDDDVHVVRMWKPRGAGSARAYLNPASILRGDLPAAVGIRVKTPDGEGIVASFMGGGNGDGTKADVFLVELRNGETVLVEAGSISCPVAKVMPLVEKVVDRSNSFVTAETKTALGTGARDLLAKIEGTVQGIDTKALELDKHFSTLKTLAEHSPELAKIVSDLEDGAAKARELQSQVEATKTVGVLLDGKSRLEAGLGEVINSCRGDESVALATERGGRLVKALTAKESPVMTKGIKLLQGAHERVVAHGDGWKTALAGLQSSSAVQDGQGRLSGMLRAAAGAGGGSGGGGGAGAGGTVQDVLGLLKGDPASRATDASLRLLENAILAFMEAVPPPRPRTTVTQLGKAGEGEERASTLSSGGKGVGEEQGGSSGDGLVGGDDAPGGVAPGGWRAQDLVDLFESGQLAEEVMRAVARQASTQALTIMERLSETHLAEDSPGLEALRLLQGYERGETGLDEAVTCALDFLNSEEGQTMAGGLVSQGERGLESLKTLSLSISKDGGVGKVLERLADPGLEKRILDGIEGLDTDEILETAEKAITDVDARTRLLDGIKDSTVEFLLEYLPHIEVPPISGSSSRVGYAITNLDLSGFRLRKEDVEVQLVDLSGGLEVAVKEGGAGNINTTTITNGGARSDGTPPGGATGSADSGEGGPGRAAAASGPGGGAAGGEDPAAVPWATSSVDGALSTSHPGVGGSLVSSPEQRRQAAYAAVLGGAGSPRLPGELQASWNHDVGEEFDGGVGIVVGEEGQGALVRPPGPPPKEEMAPAEVLRVVARGVRAEFKTLQWACRQETFPYTHGTGTADATVVDGYVSLGFSIKRGIVDQEKGIEGPLLVLSTRTVTLDRLDLTVANCRMAWLINLLTRLFSSTISTYVCRSLQQQLDGHASDLLGTVNAYAEGSWPFLLGLTSLKLEDFPLATEKELAMARGKGRPEGVAALFGGGSGGASTSPGGAGAPAEHRPLEEVFEMDRGRVSNLIGFVQEDFGVVFDEDGPLGLQVDIEKGAGVGRVLVSGLHPGGQAERLLGGTEDGAGAPAFSLVGSELLSVGGTSVEGLESQKVLGLLRASPRPVQMTFKCYVPDVAEAAAVSALTREAEIPPPPGGLATATFKQKSLGVKFRASPTLGTRVATVGGFSRDLEGRMREAEASGLLIPGQLLYSVNGKRVMGQEFADLVRRLQKVPRPVTFGMSPGVDVDVTAEAPPLELELRRVSGRVTVTGFCKVPTALEASGAIQPGDSIVSINGIPLPGAGCYRRDAALLEAPGMFPMRLRIRRGGDDSDVGLEDYAGDFGMEGGGRGALEGSLSRLKQYQSSLSGSPSEVVAATPEDLSLKVEEGSDGRPVVVSMPYVTGKLEKEGIVQPGMVLVAIDGAPVPGGHFGSVPNCRRSLDAADYPCTLTFRDAPKQLWVARVLAMRSPPA
eukprot:g11052.t1